MVMQLPEGDRYSMKYQQMIDRIAIMAGGRVAEELIFGKENITSGASSDIEQATKLGPRHGHPLGLLREAGHGGLWREPGRGLPGPFGRTQPERLGRDGPHHRRGSPSPGRLGLGRGAPDSDDQGPITTRSCRRPCWEYETLSGEEIKDLLEKGVAPNRDENNFPNAGPSVSVPVTPVSDGTEIEVPVAKPAATSVPTVH